MKFTSALFVALATVAIQRVDAQIPTCMAPRDQTCLDFLPDATADMQEGRCCCEATTAGVAVTTCSTVQACRLAGEAPNVSTQCIGSAAGLSASFALIAAVTAWVTFTLPA